MSDQDAPDIGELVLQAPDDVWKRIKKALKVGSRQEAAVMAQSDPQVQQTVLELLQGKQAGAEGGSFVTRGEPRAKRGSFVTAAGERPRSGGAGRVEI